MALTTRPAFPSIETATATRGDFVIDYDARLGVWLLGDCRTHHLALYPSYEAALAGAEEAKREGWALIDDWTFDVIRNRCTDCGRPIDRRATRCRECAALARADEAGRRHLASTAAQAKHRQDRENKAAADFIRAVEEAEPGDPAAGERVYRLFREAFNAADFSRH